MKIYTKTGDSGTTSLFSGKRVSKTSSYIEAYGTVDELNSWIGFCAAACEDHELLEMMGAIQNDLHNVCADLATPQEQPKAQAAKIVRVSPDAAKKLEKHIDKLDAELAPLKQFILAGGCELSSRLHIARTVARRAERKVIAHSEQEKANAEVIIFLNRLSDLLFVMARVANHRARISDVFWQKDE